MTDTKKKPHGNIGDYAGKTRMFSWQDWVTDELQFMEHRPTCDKCGGEGTLEPAAPTARNIIRQVFGVPNPSAEQYHDIISNPDLATLKKIQQIRGGSLYDAVNFVQQWAEMQAEDDAKDPNYVPLSELR